MTTPKAGFNVNPQNINLKGRPPKGYSITEWFRGMLSSNPKVKDKIGKAILNKALEGDIAAQRLLWSYMDGMPNQRLEHNAEVNINYANLSDDELDRLIESKTNQYHRLHL